MLNSRSVIFMDGDSFFSDRDVSALAADPGAAVVVRDSVLLRLHGGVGVSTKNALGLALFCVAERSLGNFFRQPQPARVQPVKIAREDLFVGTPLLDLEKRQLADAAEETVV